MPTIALADDHVLLRKGLASLVQGLGYTVVLEVDNGQDLVDKLGTGIDPDLVLMDINMPVKDGYEATRWIKENKPDVKVLALSMYDDESAIIRMLKNGAKGYVLKDIEPAELRTALDAVINKGFYYSEIVTGKLIHSINRSDDEAVNGNIAKLNDREIEFLKLASSELTYKEIAEQMHLSPRTIDGYRDGLFEKLNIKSRVGLVLFAIKHGIVQVN